MTFHVNCLLAMDVAGVGEGGGAGLGAALGWVHLIFFPPFVSRESTFVPSYCFPAH